jgi:hypothetical protein
MLACIGEFEDADPAKIRSVIQGCGEFGISHLGSPGSAERPPSSTFRPLWPIQIEADE